MTLYFKITNGNETHHGVKYKKGLIEDPLPWNPNTNCSPGGIYFCDKDHICQFLNYGIWLREIKIPDDAKVSFGENKHKANKVIIGKRWDLRKIETWEYLVSIGADIQAWCDEPLRWAARNGHLKLVKCLISNGADIHTENDFPLRHAAFNGHLDTVKFLVENGVDIHVDNDYPLMSATKSGHLKIVNYLVSNGANIHVHNDAPLRIAAAYGHFEIVKFLVQNDANIHTVDDRPLRLAITNGHHKIVKYLKKVMNNE